MRNALLRRRGRSLLIACALLVAGCDAPDARLVELSERASARQADQNRQMAELQRETSAAARGLVEADAQARAETLAIQRELIAEHAAVAAARDQLEAERREIARQRRQDVLTAQALESLGLALASLAPLAVCWLILRAPASDQQQELNELLLAELAAKAPRAQLTGPAAPSNANPKLPPPGDAPVYDPRDGDPTT